MNHIFGREGYGSFTGSPNHEILKYLGAGTKFLEEGHTECIGERGSSC
jgi:hypothetical protein